MSKKHISPHDRYIRSSLLTPQVAEEFFKTHLPDEVLAAIDLSSLDPQKESFIDDKLRLQIADLLYEVKFHGKPGYLYVLIEHASTPDKLLPFRLLKYSLAIMEYHLKKTGDSQLPFVYPMILYTGRRPYTYSTDLFDLFGPEKELVRASFSKPYHLIDLTQISDEALSQHLWFGITALISKHIHDPDILPVFKTSIIPLLKLIEKQGDSDYIYITLSYIVEAGEVKDRQEFIKTIKSGLSEIEEEKVMTLAEQWKQEGFLKGKQEGKEEALYTTAANLLKQGFSYEQVADATTLPIQEVQEIKKNLSH